MNRIDFMSRLSELLGDLPREEREEALQYYNDYLDDAGVENEEEVLEALGTPELLADSIRGGMHEESFFKGEFTENGFTGETQNGAEDLPAAQGKVKQKKTKERRKNPAAVIFGIICLICALPILLPVAVSVLAVVLAITLALAVTVAAVAVSILIAGIVCVLVGIAATVVAAAKLLIVPAGAAIAIGIGTFSIGIGVFLVIGGGALFCLLPAIFRGCVRICSSLFKRKGGAV